MLALHRARVLELSRARPVDVCVLASPPVIVPRDDAATAAVACTAPESVCREGAALACFRGHRLHRCASGRLVCV